MADASIGTPEQLRDPNYTPPLAQAVPLGIQHVLAMFVGVITPPLLICGVLGLDPAETAFFVSMALFTSGVTTFIQVNRMGPVGCAGTQVAVVSAS